MANFSDKLAANKRFEFVSRAFGNDKFAVVRMQGYESLSKPFRFTLTLVSDDADIDFDEVLKHPAELRIFAPDGASSTPYLGVIAEFEQLHRADGYVFYQAILVPRLWQLSLYQVSEVYLEDQGIDKTVEKVLKQGELGSADYELKLAGSYRDRSYVCQYQETHLDFLSRWMEKEGMYFYFDHAGSKEKLVIVDHLRMHAAEALKVLYRPVDEQDTGSRGDSVQTFVCRQKPLPKRVVLRDFNHRKANVELKASELVSESGIGETNIYGENFRDEAEGKRYAKIRAEEIICGSKVFSGEATAVGMRSGYFIEMDRHYRQNFNGRFLVTEVEHEGSQAAALLAGTTGDNGEIQGGTAYRASFRAIPADTQFRPERATRKPKVIGTMNAIIDAEGLGQYAELDAYGQYKVQLPFDNSDKGAGKGSARVRMASPYAGSDHGMNFPLQKNAEVLLSFVDGDPDQPVIMGAVPNSENPSIVNHNNPQENRITTKGGNQLFMSDRKGKEKTWLHSPIANSSIGIGATHDGGGHDDKGHDDKGHDDKGHDDKGHDDKEHAGGISFITAGAKEEITIGNKYELGIGTAAEIKLGVETQLEAGFKNVIGLEGKFAFSRDDEVKWVTGTQFVVEDEDSFKICHHNSSTAAGGVNLKGGHADHHVQHALYFKMKAVALAAIFTVVSANVATSAVIMSKLLGSDDQKKGDHKHEHGQVTQEKEQEFKIPLDIKEIWSASEPARLSAIGAGVNTLTSVGALLATKAILKRLAKQYDALTYVSEIDMSDKGIVQTAETKNTTTQVVLGDGGFMVRTSPKTEWKKADGAETSVINVTDGIASMTAGKKIRLWAPTVVLGPKTGECALTAETSGMSIAHGANTVKVTASKVEALGSNVAIGFLQPTPPLQAAAIAAAQANVVATEMALSVIENIFEQGRAVAAGRRDRFNAVMDGRRLLRESEERLDSARRAALAPVVHGVQVDANKSELTFATAAIKATAAGMAIRFGAGANMNFRAMGVSVDGQTIQLG